MTRKRTQTLIRLTLLGGVIVSTWTVWAKATKEALPEVEFVYGATALPGKMWTSEGGILHIRDLAYQLSATNGDLSIELAGVCNHNRNLLTGDGNFWGHDHSIEVNWGELTGTLRGIHSGKAINWIGYSTHVYHGISGDFKGWEIRLEGVWYFLEKRGVLGGTIHKQHSK